MKASVPGTELKDQEVPAERSQAHRSCGTLQIILRTGSFFLEDNGVMRGFEEMNDMI